MTLAELVRLTERGSYRIIFVDGEPPVFPDAGASLRVDGYVVETMAGPDLRGIVSDGQILEAMESSDPALVGPVDAARRAVLDIFARHPQFVFFNYARKEESGVLYAFAYGMLRQERPMKLCSLDEPDYTALRLAIDIGRARRLYHHDFADFSRRLRSIHCRDHNTILSTYAVIGALLQQMSGDEPDVFDLEQLQSKLGDAYHMVRQAKPSLIEMPQRDVFTELEWRVTGISTILYGSGPRVAGPEPREERMIGIGN